MCMCHAQLGVVWHKFILCLHFDFAPDRGQVRWACQAGREHTRRKQSTANIATTNEHARFATADTSITTVVEASLTIKGLIVVRGQWVMSQTVRTDNAPGPIKASLPDCWTCPPHHWRFMLLWPPWAKAMLTGRPFNMQQSCGQPMDHVGNEKLFSAALPLTVETGVRTNALRPKGTKQG